MTRVYVLIDTTEGKSKEVAKVLLDKPGVKLCDVLEGSPNVIVVIEASGRQRLAKLTNQALAWIETMVGDVRLLPSQNGRS